jgi:hypothetical protein
MKKAMKRALGAGGALALAASAVLIPAAAAQADGNYYGAWTLTAWKLNGKTIECPGRVPLPPPAPSISCKAGETLELKSGYRYKSTIANFSHKGAFEVLKFPKSASHTIVFDADDESDDPRAYQMKLQGAGSGTPKKMVIFLSTGRAGAETTIKMILRRDAD